LYAFNVDLLINIVSLK